MADPRMSKVFTYIRPTLNENPLPGTSAVAEFAEFWRPLTDEEKDEYAAGVPE